MPALSHFPTATLFVNVVCLQHLCLPFCTLSYLVPIAPICLLNPTLPPLQRVVLMCNADPLYLTSSE